MPKQSMTRKSSDNQYLHKDFHIALNHGLDYLQKNMGRKAVKEYLTQFANTYYFPLKTSIKKIGLRALKEHYEKIYKIESADFKINISQDELTIHLLASPAVGHIKSKGIPVSESFCESVITVNKTICRDTLYDMEMLEYNDDTGAYRMRFFRRTA